MYDGNYYQLMARYNQWINRSLYGVCAQIDDGQRKADRGAFFKSIHSTLNHILWGDRMWLARFGAATVPPVPLGEDWYTDFTDLQSEREKTDTLLIDWTNGLNDAVLLEIVEFTSASDAKTRRAPRWIFAVQMFNHQTHHRGQVTTLVKQLGYDPGVTDIPWTPGVIEYVNK